MKCLGEMVGILSIPSAHLELKVMSLKQDQLSYMLSFFPISVDFK